MNLLLRCIWVLLQSYRSQQVLVSSIITQNFRLWPHDLGWRNHLPNYRVFSFMELGRIGLWHQSRLATQGHYTTRIIAAQDYVYIRPVMPLQKFTLKTQLVAYDEKYCYYQQDIWLKNKLAGTALVKEAHMLKGKTVNIADVLPSDIRAKLPTAKEHAVIASWLATQNTIKQHQIS